jgi:hypothetical protein
MKKTFLFILNNYNDVDQTAPLITTLLEDSVCIKILCLSDFDLKQDPRIRHFNSYSTFSVATFPLLLLLNRGPKTIRWVSREIFFNVVTAFFFLALSRISLCVYTWCNPRRKGFQSRIFLVAKKMGIPNVCLPHGQNIFLNYDVNTHLRKFHSENNAWPDFSPRNEFDLYVVQTYHHRQMNLDWGMSPNKICALGSMRFFQSWVDSHAQFFPPYNGFPLGISERDVRIVFFVPHWHYNVDEPRTTELIKLILQNKNFLVAIKGHTRGHQLDSEDETGLHSGIANIDLNTTASSSSLIQWCDVAINFGSSIGLEAIVAGKPVINPKFLHTNRTVFDKSGAVIDAESEDQVIAVLNDAQEGQSIQCSIGQREMLIKSEICAENVDINPALVYKNALFEIS